MEKKVWGYLNISGYSRSIQSGSTEFIVATMSFHRHLNKSTQEAVYRTSRFPLTKIDALNARRRRSEIIFNFSAIWSYANWKVEINSVLVHRPFQNGQISIINWWVYSFNSGQPDGFNKLIARVVPVQAGDNNFHLGWLPGLLQLGNESDPVRVSQRQFQEIIYEGIYVCENKGAYVSLTCNPRDGDINILSRESCEVYERLQASFSRWKFITPGLDVKRRASNAFES